MLGELRLRRVCCLGGSGGGVDRGGEALLIRRRRGGPGRVGLEQCGSRVDGDRRGGGSDARTLRRTLARRKRRALCRASRGERNRLRFGLSLAARFRRRGLGLQRRGLGLGERGGLGGDLDLSGGLGGALCLAPRRACCFLLVAHRRFKLHGARSGRTFHGVRACRVAAEGLVVTVALTRPNSARALAVSTPSALHNGRARRVAARLTIARREAAARLVPADALARRSRGREHRLRVGDSCVCVTLLLACERRVVAVRVRDLNAAAAAAVPAPVALHRRGAALVAVRLARAVPFAPTGHTPPDALARQRRSGRGAIVVRPAQRGALLRARQGRMRAGALRGARTAFALAVP